MIVDTRRIDMKKLELAIEEVQKAKNVCWDAVLEEMKDFLTGKEGAKLVFTGYTPSFNDGDACEFTFCVNEDDYADWENSALADICWEFADQLTCMAVVEELFRHKYGVEGFKLTYTLKEGELSLNEEDYDCEY